MISANRVIIDKNFLKKSLLEKEDISKAISRFIDNSIIAMRGIVSSNNQCKVDIKLFEDLIVISDNSGGFKSNLSGKDIFKIGNYNGYEISGLGIKKSLFKLGNKIDIVSNKKECSKKFTVDFNLNSDELLLQAELIEYNSSKVEGSEIFISDLEKDIQQEIISLYFIDNILCSLGRIYSKFIEKGELIIIVNERLVKPISIELPLINTCNILNNYKVNLYKGSKSDISGIDFFMNDYMIYNREKSKEVKWNLLNESRHTYTNCILEINYYGEKSNFIKDKEKVFAEVINFVKNNRVYFQSKTITIQYEMPIEKVDQLKEYYDEITAKAVGIKSFNKLYENFLFDRNKESLD